MRDGIKEIIEEIIQSLTMPTETFAFIKEEPEARQIMKDFIFENMWSAGRLPERNPIRSLTCCGNSCMFATVLGYDKAIAVFRSLPGALPIPNSILSG